MVICIFQYKKIQFLITISDVDTLSTEEFWSQQKSWVLISKHDFIRKHCAKKSLMNFVEQIKGIQYSGGGVGGTSENFRNKVRLKIGSNIFIVDEFCKKMYM